MPPSGGVETVTPSNDEAVSTVDIETNSGGEIGLFALPPGFGSAAQKW